MKKKTVFLACAMTAAVALNAPTALFAADKDKDQAPKSDNAKMNKQEKGETAEQQKENKGDLELTRNIRRAVVKDKTLSVYGHNVKIITRDGKVTLKGPVRSEEEKMTVEKHAVQVAGKENVTNQLTLAPKKEKKEEKKGEKSEKK